MKKFFSEYGWVIVVAVIVTIVLMFVNPLGQTTFKQESNMGDILRDKTMEFTGLQSSFTLKSTFDGTESNTLEHATADVYINGELKIPDATNLSGNYNNGDSYKIVIKPADGYTVSQTVFEGKVGDGQTISIEITRS